MPEWGNISEVITAVATFLAVVVGGLAIRAKRRDDRWADRLSRLNQQLSQLYGKLFILNEAGHRNWCAFVLEYSNDNKELGRYFMRFFPYEQKENEPTTFFNPTPPNAEQLKAYRLWLRTLFMNTNERILEAITANADLVVEGKMRNILVDFAEHVATLRLVSLKLQESEQHTENSADAFLADWKNYVKDVAPHPAEMGYYVVASYEILKEEQERLLSSYGKPLSETEIAYRIEIRKWEKENFWDSESHKARAKIGQNYEYKPNPKPERTYVSLWKRFTNNRGAER